MVQRIVPPELIKFGARSYFKAVRKAFHDEPAKYSKFVKLWYHSKTHKLDRASAIAMVKELMKDHPNLILGFYAFLPPEANKGFGQSQTMVGRRRTPDATMDAAFSYAVDLMEAFYAEPEKFDEFTKLLKDMKAHRVDVATGYARVGELLKDHRNLLIGLNAFLPPEAKIIIPPEANTTIAPEAKKPTHSDVMDYLKKTKEALHDEPAKFKEFMKLLDDIKTRRLGVDNAVAKLEELMKDHPNVLLGFYFLFPKRKKTIPSEAEQQAAAKNNKRERALNFVRKLKCIGYHVFVSFSVIMEIYRDGNMSRDKVYHEVAAILRAQGLEDLVMELPEFFNVIADWPTSTEDSQNLLLGFNDFLPAGAKITILPEPNRTIPPEVKTTIAPEAKTTIAPEAKTTIAPEAKKPTLYDPRDHLKKIKEAFHDEPAKFEEFIKLLNDFGAHSAVAKLEELMNDHRNLLLDFHLVIPKRKITFPREAEQRVRDFIGKLKSIGYHVAALFGGIMNMYKDGNKSRNEAYQGLVALLRVTGHEDLVMEVPQVFNAIHCLQGQHLLEMASQVRLEDCRMLEYNKRRKESVLL